MDSKLKDLIANEIGLESREIKSSVFDNLITILKGVMINPRYYERFKKLAYDIREDGKNISESIKNNERCSLVITSDIIEINSEYGFQLEEKNNRVTLCFRDNKHHGVWMNIATFFISMGYLRMKIYKSDFFTIMEN